jgi:propanol-preferring alcohol dehydrogenase
MKKLMPGGRLVINAIRKEEFDKDALLDLSYHEHLWMEREIKSVANLTHTDIAEFLPLAGNIPLRSEVTIFPLEQANEALHNLRQGGIKGANVLTIN